jgi:HEAT repeats
MRYRDFLLAIVAATSIAWPVRAWDFWGKHPKPNPAERVPQLVVTVKADPDEDKRAAAVKELREYDPNSFKDIIPVLIDVLQHDPKPSVRAEAATSLSKLRPISQEVGWALEEATKDSSIRVRFTARNVLMSYRISGYRSNPKPDGNLPAPQQSSGPLHSLFSVFQSKPETGSTNFSERTSAVIHRGGETPPPPLAIEVAPASPPRPLPAPLVPATQPKPAQPQPADQGPDLPQG